VQKSLEAQAQDREARQQAKDSADNAAAAARTLSEVVSVIPETVDAIELGFESAKQFAALAVAVATDGDFTSAMEALGEARREADSAASSAKKLQGDTRSAHGVLLGWLETRKVLGSA
jgi:hypothetical protein